MICHVCEGSGCHMLIRNGRPEYWSCPCCRYSGVTVMYGPATTGRARLVRTQQKEK